MAAEIFINDTRIEFEDYTYRTPLKFGGAIVDKVTLLNVYVDVEDDHGQTMQGFSSMPLGNVWAFPSKVHSYDQTLNAMKQLARAVCDITKGYNETEHPIGINHSLEPLYRAAATNVQQELQMKEEIPPLCTLVVASPFDAAIHDAYGKLHGLNCYSTYGQEYMTHDLSYYLGKEFENEYLDQYTQPQAKPTMPLYHLIGAVDPLTEADITDRLNDSIAQTLPEWIRQDGLTHLKIKLNGDNLEWDINRVVDIDRVTKETQKERGVSNWVYSLDFNEKCESVDYLLEFLKKVEAQSPNALERVQYIEQPTARDLKAHPDNKMHKAAEVKPVVIDESLVDYESLLLAREQGYTGVALKACKGQSQALLMAAAAQKFDMFLCVQDLTCPGASFLHSAGLAAHIPPVAAIEGNARQFVPSANEGWQDRFPGIFNVENGQIKTDCLDGPGLGVVPPQKPQG